MRPRSPASRRETTKNIGRRMKVGEALEGEERVVVGLWNDPRRLFLSHQGPSCWSPPCTKHGADNRKGWCFALSKRATPLIDQAENITTH